MLNWLYIGGFCEMFSPACCHLCRPGGTLGDSGDLLLINFADALTPFELETNFAQYCIGLSPLNLKNVPPGLQCRMKQRLSSPLLTVHYAAPAWHWTALGMAGLAEPGGGQGSHWYHQIIRINEIKTCTFKWPPILYYSQTRDKD